MFLSDRKLANVSTRTIKPLRQRATTPGAFLLRSLDGKFTSGLLTAQGNEFASSYYDFEKGEYLNDYETTLGKGLKDLYYVADTWQNYDQLKPVIDRRFAEWKARN
jgi:hypothetical protein